MMRRIIDNIISFIKLSILPIKIHRFLRNGTFKYNNTTNVLYNLSVLKVCELPQVFGMISSSKNPFRCLFSSVYRYYNVTLDRVFEGDFMIISSSEHEYKFFNVSENILLTYFDNGDKLIKVYENRREWAQYFSVVPSDVDIHHKTIKEKIIKQQSFESESMFKAVLADYSGYFDIRRNEEIFRSHFSISSEELSLFKEVWPDKESFYDMELFLHENALPAVRLHGDLWRSNILYDGSQHYYLDFENVGYKLFYFDIFYYMVSDALLLDYDVLLLNYFSGTYDKHMSVLFNTFGLSYNNQYRYLYYLLFVLEVYTSKLSKENRDIYIQQYFQIYKKILS